MSYYVIPCTPIGPQELKSWILSIGHIARSCCYVLPVALLNKEFKRQYCENKKGCFSLQILTPNMVEFDAKCEFFSQLYDTRFSDQCK